MERAKIQFSSAEEEMMQDSGIILTKNRVLQKWSLLLEAVQEGQQQWVKDSGIGGREPFIISGKISRGENYEGLPWLILDYPRASSGKDLFFIRSMFWWGHFFSSTLHLAGSYQTKYGSQLQKRYKDVSDLYISINTDPWVHHFEESNYRSIASIGESGFGEALFRSGHTKIAAQWPLAQWQQAPTLMFTKWKFLLECCGLVP